MGARAVTVANGCACGDVGAAREDDVGGGVSKGAAQAREREGLSGSSVFGTIVPVLCTSRLRELILGRSGGLVRACSRGEGEGPWWGFGEVGLGQDDAHGWHKPWLGHVRELSPSKDFGRKREKRKERVHDLRSKR
jgi:hypothetical protein